MVINPQKFTLAMARACISSAELREMASVSSVTLMNIQKGKQNLRPVTAGRLARALCCDVTELIDPPIKEA